MENEKQELTLEQWWELCCLDERKKEVIENTKTTKDKAVDWDYERMIWDKWNPKNFK